MLPFSADLAARLLAEAPDLISLHEPDGTFRWASAAARTVLGCEAAALIGQSALPFIHPADAAAVSAELASLLVADDDDGSARLITCRLIRADGTVIRAETHARVLRGDGPGGCPQLLVVTRDITARVFAESAAAEQAAIDAQAQLALAADAAGLGLSVRDLKTTELLINPAMARLYGLPPGTTATRLETLLALTHPDDRRRIRPVFEAALREAGNTSQTQFRIRQADTGQERTVLSAARAEAGADGAVRRILSVSLDVSELTAARAAAEQLDYWQTLTDGLPEIMWFADASALITQRLNRRWFDYTGQSPDVLLDQSWVRAVHPTDMYNPETHRATQACISAGQPYEVKFRIRRHDGAWRWFQARAAPLHDATGRLTHWVGLTVDVHERELDEMRLRRAIADLDTFVYAAAHDLKSPIDNLEGIISGLRDEIGDYRLTHPLDEIDRAQDVLLDHASQSIARFRATLADMAQVVAAQAPDDAPAQPLDLTTLVSDLVLDMQAEFAAADGILCLDLRVPTLGGLPARHLRSVLFNLITNSLKYRMPGRPARLWLRTRPARGGHIILSLSDNGLGLDAARAARAFELFGRLHPGAAGGTGIGLFIVRRIIEQAGGEMRVRGRVGEGTTFSFYLPGGDIRRE